MTSTEIPTTFADLFADAEIISVYTRAQGIEDGVLVDVSDTAREAGITFPVALTRAAWDECVTWTRTDALQDESGRLWDVLWMFGCAARRGVIQGDRGTFSLLRIPNTGRGHTARKVNLVAVCGPGDTAEPVITIMCPGES